MRNTLICPQTDSCPIYSSWIRLIGESIPPEKIRTRIDIIEFNQEKNVYQCEALDGIFTADALKKGIPQDRLIHLDAECSLIKMVNDTDKIKRQFDKEVYSR